MDSDRSHTEFGWSGCESVIRRFEGAWHSPQRPKLEAFLPSSGPLRTRLLVELAHVDLEFRLRAGEDARVEEYIERFPELAGRECMLGLIATEYELRNRVPDGAFPEEYLLRFPELGAELTQVLTVGQTDDLAATRARRPALSAPVGVPDVPGCEIEEQVGRGGMGIVYRARQPALKRTVAVKTLAALPGSEEHVRFRREAEAVARLDHPNIIAIYEVGQWQPPAGPAVPYFIMEWCAGGGLDNAPCGRGTDPKTQARILERVARAVHHAHQRGVLHRDLKPSNILLDAQGQPHVADFGLAGWYDTNDPRSMTAAVVGTPAYMAPEQARAPAQVTTAADVWGLGAVLYHQLTGEAPFMADSPLATLELAATTPVRRPSTLNPAVPRDLEIICLKCLEKDPNRRYPSAEALADDLQRFLDGRPILARRTPLWERAVRRMRRHRLALAMAALVVLSLLITGVPLAISKARLEVHQKQAAEALKRERQSLYLDRITEAGRLYRANLLDQAWQALAACPPEHRGWEWHYLDQLRHEPPLVLPGHSRWISSAVYLADGKLATADSQGIIRIWDVATQTDLRRWGTSSPPVVNLSAHPQKPWLAVADETSVAIWDVNGPRLVKRLQGSTWACFSHDGKRLACADGSSVRVWRVDDWSEEWHMIGHERPVMCGDFSPSGHRLLTGSLDRTVRVWNLANGQPDGEPWTRMLPPMELRFISDGLQVALADLGRIYLLHPNSGEILGRVETPASERPRLAIGPDRRWLAVNGTGGEVRLWNLRHARESRQLRGNVGRSIALPLRRDGLQLAAGNDDGTVRVWDLARNPEVQTLVELGPWANGLSTATDGSLIAVGTRPMGRVEDEVVRLFDVNGSEVKRLPALGPAAFHPDSKRIAVHRHDGSVALLDCSTGEELWSKPRARPNPTSIAFSGDGRYVASAAGVVRVFDAQRGEVVAELTTRERNVQMLAFSADGSRLAGASSTGVHVWDMNTMESLPWCDAPEGAFAVAFSADGKLLASADRDRMVRVRNPDSGKLLVTLAGSPDEIDAVAFSPDGTRIATGGRDGAVRIWDVVTGRELLTLPGARVPVTALVWHADGRLIALDDSVRIWRASPQ